MQYNIHINQKGLDNDKEISLTEASVIDWLHNFCGSNSRKINNQRVDGWTWVNCQHLIDDMPLLRIKGRSGSGKLLGRLEKLGYIEIRREPRKLFIKTTDKMDSLYIEVSHKTQGVSTKIQSSIPQDTYHNTNTIILNQDTTDVPKGTILIPPPKEPEPPFLFKEAFEKLGNSTWKPHKIIYNYWKVKGFEYENKKQFDSAVKRELRPAKLLEGYSAVQINKTMEYCKDNYTTIPWTLETVVKRVSDIINKKLA